MIRVDAKIALVASMMLLMQPAFAQYSAQSVPAYFLGKPPLPLLTQQTDAARQQARLYDCLFIRGAVSLRDAQAKNAELRALEDLTEKLYGSARTTDRVITLPVLLP